MMPAQLLSYYPTYSILDEILSYGQYKTVNLYIDLKNVLQSIYMEHAVINMVETTLKSRFIDTSVFSSVVSFIAFHKLYAIKRNINLNIFIFFESGNSIYHKNISKKYKIRRKLDDLYGLDREKRELFYDILQKNFQLIEKVFNSVPNVKVIHLSGFEADFIPYYLINNHFHNSDNIGHIIYSNDHDMLQCLDKNVYIFQKIKTGKNLIKRIVKKGETFQTYLKEDNIPDEYLPLYMGIAGDKSDDVDGVYGIGIKNWIKLLPELIEITGGIDNLINNVINKKPIFDKTRANLENKQLKKIIDEEENNNLITNNIKMTSFKVISRYFQDPDTIEMLQRKDKLMRIIENNQTVPYKVMKDALLKNDIVLSDEEFQIIYYKKE